MLALFLIFEYLKRTLTVSERKIERLIAIILLCILCVAPIPLTLTCILLLSEVSSLRLLNDEVVIGINLDPVDLHGVS